MNEVGTTNVSESAFLRFDYKFQKMFFEVLAVLEVLVHSGLKRLNKKATMSNTIEASASKAA